MSAFVTKHVLPSAILLLFCVLSSASAWSFVAFADFHGTNSFSFNRFDNGDTDEEKTEWNKKLAVLRSINATYGGDMVLLPGDVNSYGNLETKVFADELGLPEDTAVYVGAFNCYSNVRKLFKEAGYDKVLATVGDHELGGNVRMTLK